MNKTMRCLMKIENEEQLSEGETKQIWRKTVIKENELTIALQCPHHGA